MKLLFVTHNTSRTGAPMVLLHFLRWIRTHRPDFQVDVLALKGGGLQQDFKANCSAFMDYGTLLKPQKLSLIQRVLKKMHLYVPKDNESVLMDGLLTKGYDIIYGNTIATIPLVLNLTRQSEFCKSIVHVHELNAVIKQVLPDFKEYLPLVDRVIVPSRLVLNNLKQHWGQDETKVRVVYECAEVFLPENLDKKREGGFVVGASGTVHWRKGQDVFIQLSRFLTKHHPEANIRFVWVGALSNSERAIIDEDLRKLGLQEKVFFLGEVENPAMQYKNFDVLVMTSREDPFPLVCIEVGQMGIPILSFEHASGTNEMLKEGGGQVVPYLDIEAMAEKIMEYYSNLELAKRHGLRNKTVFSQFTPDVICPQLMDVVEEAYAS